MDFYKCTYCEVTGKNKIFLGICRDCEVIWQNEVNTLMKSNKTNINISNIFAEATQRTKLLKKTPIS